MAKSRLELIIDATDNASGVLDKISGVAKFGLAAGLAAAGAAAAGLAAVLVSSVNEAMNAQEVFAETNSILESTGGVSGMTAESIGELANSLMNVTRFEDETIQSAENMLLTFTKIGKDVFPQATEAALNMAEKFGGDVSTQAVMLGKALNDPIQGVSALRRVGIQLTEQQEAQIAKFMELGDVASAQKVILGELDTQLGGLARAMGGTLAGQMERFQNQLGNVKEEIGAALLPVLAQLMTALGPTLITAAQGLAAFITGTLVPAFQQFADFVSSELIPRIEPTVAFIEANLKPILAGLATALTVTVIPAFVAWAAAAGTAAAATVAALAPVLVPIAAIVAAVALLTKAWDENWFGIRDTLTAVWEGTVQPAIETLVNWLQVNIPIAIETLVTFWNDTLLPAMQVVWAWVSENLIPLFEAIGNLLGTVISLAVEVLAGYFNKVLLPAFQVIGKFLEEKILPALTALADWLGPKLGPIINGLATGALAALRGAFDGISSAIQSVIGFIENMTSKLQNIKLPAWLTPGSPTPFEVGLVGIGDALRQLSARELPAFQAALRLNEPALPGFGAGGSMYAGAGHGGGGGYTINITQTLPTGTSAETARAAWLGADDGVRAAMRAVGAA